MELSQIEKSIFVRLKSWYMIGKPIWLCLLVGLLWFMVELILWLSGFRESASVASGGAIMVGAAVIAQTYYTRLPVRIAMSGSGMENLKRQANFANPYIRAISANEHHGQQCLYKLASSDDFVDDVAGSGRKLVLGLVLYRVDKNLEFAIAVTAAIGTVIWAYAGQIL